MRFFASLDAEEIVFQIIKNDRDIQVFILDLNRFDQLFDQGINSKGDVIGFYRGTSRGKKLGQIKQAGDHYDFLDTGEFFDSFKVIPTKKFFEIVADGQKGAENLFDKYGQELTGLTEESKEKLAEELILKIQEYIKFKALSI